MTKSFKGISAIILSIFLAAIMVWSLTYGAHHFTDPATYAHQMESLDKKRDDVLGMSAASAAASAAITLLPGDIATPIADKLADISGYFLLVLGAIYAEKYALTILGALAFYVLIPAACAFFIFYLYIPLVGLRRLSLRLIALALCLILLIPVSTLISDMIDDTYQESIQQTMDAANALAQEVQEEVAITEEDDDQSILEKAKDLLSDTVSSLSWNAEKLLAKVRSEINRFGEALVVMFISSCAIPILVIVVFIAIIKMIFQINVPMPKHLPRASKHIHRAEHDRPEHAPDEGDE